MICLLDEEVRSTIAVLTKNRERNLNNIVIHRHGETMDSFSVMGICNNDFSIIEPMYNWTKEEIKDYITSPMQRLSIDIISDVDFAYFYTRSRVVTWARPNYKR